jgi:hypothetical protein
LGKFYEGVAEQLELYVRQLAWLNTAPRVDHKVDPEAKAVTRVKKLKVDDGPINLPPNPADFITDWLMEIGPIMGDRPISEQELAAWQSNSGIELDAWEARTIRRLSKAFLSQHHEAEEPECPEPFVSDEAADVEAREQYIDASIEALFAGFKKAD